MKFFTKSKRDAFEKIDDQSDSKKRNKFTKLPPLPDGFLDSVIKGSFYGPDLEVLDAPPKAQIDLSSISHEAPCFRAQRLDVLDWDAEVAVLQGDVLTCYVDAQKTQISFCGSVSYVVTEGNGFQSPYTQQNLECQKLLIFCSNSSNRRTVLGFSDFTQFHDFSQALSKMLSAKYSSKELQEKEAKMQQYQMLWAHQIRDTIHRFYQANEEILQHMEVITGNTVKKQFQSLVNFIGPPTVDGGGTSKISLFVVLYSTTLHFYRRSDDTAQGLSKAYTVVPLQYIMAVTAKGKTVSIATPLINYYFRCKSDAAAVQWQTVLTKSLTQLHLNFDAEEVYINRYGYVYDKTLVGKARIDEVRGFGEKPHKSWKITKAESTVGRSSSNDILLADTYLSRCQGKFVIHKNVPYFVDMSGTSFKLNEEKVHGVVALKPGDMLGLGKSFVVFGVKPGVKFSIDKNLAREPQVAKPPVLAHECTKKLEATSISEEL